MFPPARIVRRKQCKFNIASIFHRPVADKPMEEPPLLTLAPDTPARKAETESYGTSSSAQKLGLANVEVISSMEVKLGPKQCRPKKKKARPVEWNFVNASKFLHEIGANCCGSYLLDL